EKAFSIEDPTIKAPVLILPRKFAIKKSKRRTPADVLDSTPAAIAAGENNKVEKDDKRVSWHRTASIHSPPARCYDHNMHHIPTNNSA
ncbi:hypothetical protein JTE90_009605, partial [Oedothorax gibbosus]